MLEILPILDSNKKTPLYIQIYDYIKKEILCGSILPKTKLPSIRSLAKNLNLSKNTIELAYQQLIAEGYVVSKNRSGLYVEELTHEFIPPTKSEIITFVEKIIPPIKYDFSSGQIDLDSFPYSQFRKILMNCVDECAKDLLFYGDPQGDYGLRYEIAKYVHSSRGVICSPDQILISSGTQYSLTILSLVLSKFSSYIAFEDPGYLGAKNVFRNLNFNIIPINLEADGIDVNSLSKSSAKIVYVTPSHQYPCGMVMSISKRLKLLQWVNDTHGFIIEDDYDGEFRYKGKPILSLQGLDNSERVIYLGSFSKSLMPSIRLSYLVLPKELLSIYKSYYGTYAQPVPRLLQKSIEIFIREGYWEKHLRKARILYKKKQEVLINSVQKYFNKDAEIIGQDSGLHILLKINTKAKESELIENALSAGIKVEATSVNWINNKSDKLPVIFIGFAGIKLEDIPNGIKALHKSIY